MRNITKLAAGAALLASATAAWTLTHHFTNNGRPTSATTTLSTRSTTTSSTTTSPTTSTTPVSMGEGEARRAAVAILELDEQLFPNASPETARALTESIAASNARARLGDEAALHQRQRLAEGTTDLVLRIAPIVERTVSFSERAATIEIYFVRLWSFPGTGAVDDYATVELHLVAENGRWLLESSSLIDGPTPVFRTGDRSPTMSEAARFEDRLAGFTDTGLVP